MCLYFIKYVCFFYSFIFEELYIINSGKLVKKKEYCEVILLG